MGKNGDVAPSIPSIANPVLLQWARQSVGYDLVGAARKIGVPVDRLAAWERGDDAPTVALLKKIADVYKRPLGIFFLPEPPMGFDAMRDFRRLELESTPWSPELHAEYRRALTQRDYALELAEIDDRPPSTAWQLTIPGSDDLQADDEAVAAAARAHLLGLSPIPLPSGAGTKYDHLNTWTAAVEESGILVMATQRGGVSINEMRAFCLYFDVLPVIMVNGSDGARGRLFSILHEYAHLTLGSDALCDTTTDVALRSPSPERAIEAKCNAIAAAMLMPQTAVLSSPIVVQMRGQSLREWDYSTLREAAAPFGASAEAFLRRLATLGEVDLQYYADRREDFLEAYEAEEAQSSSGGNWYRTTVRDLGKWYVRSVADAHRRRVIDSYTAASFLNVKVDQIPRLAAEAALTAEV